MVLIATYTLGYEFTNDNMSKRKTGVLNGHKKTPTLDTNRDVRVFIFLEYGYYAAFLKLSLFTDTSNFLIWIIPSLSITHMIK